MCGDLKRIMVAEDDVMMQKLIRYSLEKLGGFTLKICPSGEDILGEMVDFKPDLFVLDVLMPEMDGPETLEKIRKEAGFESVPVVFLTASTYPDELARLKKTGVLDVISKPFNPKTLPDLMREKWQAYNA